MNIRLELLKTNIDDAYRYARNNDTRVTSAMSKYLEIGKEMPTAAMFSQVDAINSSKEFYKEEKRLGNILTKHDLKVKWNKMLSNFAEAELEPKNFCLINDIQEELERMYPETYEKRMKIIMKQLKKAMKL